MIYALIGLAIVIVVNVLLVIWDAKHSVTNAPRADMFLCERHGAIPMKYVVMLDMAGITDDPLPYCPFCFEDKMKLAKGSNVQKSN